MTLRNFLMNNKLFKLGWPALLAPPVIAFIIGWFLLKSVWPGINFWYYILLPLFLFILVILGALFEGILIKKKNKAFVRKLNKISKDFAKSHNLSLEKDESGGSIKFSFEHPLKWQCQIIIERFDKKPMLFARVKWSFGHKDISNGVRGKGESKELASLEEKYIFNVLVEAHENILTWQKPPENKEDEIINSIDLESLPGPKRSGLIYYRDEVVWSPNHKHFALAYSICEVTMGNEVGYALWGTVEKGKATIMRNSIPFLISSSHRPWCKWLNDEIFICKAHRYDRKTLSVPLVAIHVHQGFQVLPETNIFDFWFDDIEKVDGEFQPFDEIELTKEIEKTGQWQN
jgi:hypothetical protein